MKSFYSLPTGSVFKAQILDIQPGRVTIQLGGGSRFTARSLVYPDAHIGEESYFRVKVNNFDGLIQLEMVKGTPSESQSDDASDMDKSTFLAKEGLPADITGMKALDAALDPERHLTKLLESAGVEQYISFDSFEKQLKPLEQYYNELKDTLMQLKESVIKGEKPSGLLQKLDAIEENLSFMRRVSKHVRYYQIPFIHQNRTGQGELFRYKSGKSVVAMDTVNLGRIEVVLNGTKDDKHVAVQFRGDTDDILALIKSKSPRLSRDLYRKGFQITELSYQKRTERTTVLTGGPAKEPRRQVFDMRV